MRLMGETMGLHRRITGGPMITHRRRIEIETEIETEIAALIVTAIMIVTGMASRITTCTLRPGLL